MNINMYLYGRMNINMYLYGRICIANLQRAKNRANNGKLNRAKNYG